MPTLEWKLLTRKRGSFTGQGIPPGKQGLLWVASTVTLIYGQRDAVLVDTFLFEQHSRELLDWVVESGKNLTTIYITHAHGDHFFGLKHLLDKFPYLAECDEKARGEWLCALDTIEALHPQAVIAGHGVLDPDSSPHHIEDTRRYIHDFNACLAATSTPLELYERMLSLHPKRVNPGSLWAAAKAAKPS